MSFSKDSQKDLTLGGDFLIIYLKNVQLCELMMLPALFYLPE